MNSRDVLFEGSKNLSGTECYRSGELSSLVSLLESRDDGRRVLKHFEFCKSTLRNKYYVCTQGYASFVISTCMSQCLCSCSCCIHYVQPTVEHFQFFLRKSVLPGIPDGGSVFELRTDIGVIRHFFNFLVTGLYISFDKSKSFLCFPCDVIYVGSPV